MLQEILLLVDEHGKRIKEAEGLLDQVRRNVEGQGLEKCCYELPATGPLTGKRSKNEDLLRKKTLLDEMYEALRDRVKAVVRSKDHLVEASGIITPLIKYLSEIFMSTIKNPTERNDAEILDFIISQEPYITKFMQNECARSIASCLVDRIKAETSQNDIMLVSGMNVTPPTKVKETIESEISHNLAAGQEKGNESNEPLKTSMYRVNSMAEKEGNVSKTVDDKDIFPISIQDLNSEQQTLYGTLLTDHLDGVEEVVNKLSKDPDEINGLINSLKVNIQKDEERETDTNKETLISQKLSNLPRINKECMEYDPSNGELIIALDEALCGLEIDIRDNLLKTSNDKKPQSKFRGNPRVRKLRKMGII